MKSKSLNFSLLLMIFAAFTACDDDNDDNITPEITITQTSFSLNGIDTIAIPFTVNPADYSVNENNLEIVFDNFSEMESGSSLSGIFSIPQFSIINVATGNTTGGYVASVKVAPNVETTQDYHAEANMVIRLEERYDSNPFTLTIDIENETEAAPDAQ